MSETTSRLLDKVPWVIRVPLANNTISSTVPDSNDAAPDSGQETEGANDPDEDEPGRDDSASDDSSVREQGYVSIAVFDILFRNDNYRFNEEDGTVRFKSRLEAGFPNPLNVTQPVPGKQYIAIFRMGMNEVVYKCEASAAGMGWEKFKAFRRNRTFKREFQDDDIDYMFSQDIVDDDGVPLLKVFLGPFSTCTTRSVGCWAKMRDNSWEEDHATLSDAEIAKIKVYENMED